MSLLCMSLCVCGCESLRSVLDAIAIGMVLNEISHQRRRSRGTIHFFSRWSSEAVTTNADIGSDNSYLQSL